MQVNVRKTIHLNCGERYEDVIDHCNLEVGFERVRKGVLDGLMKGKAYVRKILKRGIKKTLSKRATEVFTTFFTHLSLEEGL